MSKNMSIKSLTFEAAQKAFVNAYAPYSGFHVGAAIRTKDGRTFGGCNVENASYGATVCAERGALFSAIADSGVTEFDHLVVVSSSDPPAVPCALCLQVLSEFCGADFPVYLADTGGIKKSVTLGELLPYPFNEIPK
ncbi:MAG: cytidine deaminase [Spirochaetaceae bacterium]